MTGESHILFEHRGAVGLITLNRPKALNALTRDMCLRMKAQLDAWANDSAVQTVVIQGAGDKAFCAGGDIRALYETGKAGTASILDFYRDEYILNAAIKHYPKPYVALISGIVMGGGAGVSVHGGYRIADETTLFAMPGTGIGLFPDAGGSYFLPRMKGELGLYLALTGTRLKMADAIHAGVATNYVYADNRAEFLRAMVSGQKMDVLLEEFSEAPGDAPLALHRAAIDRHFSLWSVEDILASLDADASGWARETAAMIRVKSPTATKLAFRQIREGKALSFDECMRMEFRMVNRVVVGHDFYEGVRATIIDKDGAPKWRPAVLADVSDTDIDAHFAPLGENELGI
jgi:enoyl-CoA hydratase